MSTLLEHPATHINHEISDLRHALRTHALYENLKEISDLKLFMQYHAFAVWDFMSLLKYLQRTLTCVELPWMPSPNPEQARFINEIVLEEETDVNELGEVKSHFEMYLDAMAQMGADVNPIQSFLELIRTGTPVEDALRQTGLPQGVVDFVQYSFSLIDTQQPHLVAAAFTFGREGIIPDMFLEILQRNDAENTRYNKLGYYLQRHIELDGDEHGQLALQIVASLCGDDSRKWAETLEVARQSLSMRIRLWDTIHGEIIRTRTAGARSLNN